MSCRDDLKNKILRNRINKTFHRQKFTPIHHLTENVTQAKKTEKLDTGKNKFRDTKFSWRFFGEPDLDTNEKKNNFQVFALQDD